MSKYGIFSECTVEYSVKPTNFHMRETQKMAKMEIFRDESTGAFHFHRGTYEPFIIHVCCEENTKRNIKLTKLHSNRKRGLARKSRYTRVINIRRENRREENNRISFYSTTRTHNVRNIK